MATANPSFGYFASSEELGPAEIIRTAKTAEAAGFDRLWVSDHYHPWMSEQGSSPFVWSVLGALASTTALKLTTAVTCPTFRIHPAIIAQATATTAVMAPGRFTFGVGTGEALNEHILGDVWPPVSVRHARLTEALEIIRQLWTGQVVTYQGTYFTVHDAKLFTRPETPPDILVSGFGPEATKLAAQIGQGWISTSPDADGMKIYRDAGGTGRTQAGAKICWAETEKEAKETARRLGAIKPAAASSPRTRPCGCSTRPSPSSPRRTTSPRQYRAGRMRHTQPKPSPSTWKPDSTRSTSPRWDPIKRAASAS